MSSTRTDTISGPVSESADAPGFAGGTTRDAILGGRLTVLQPKSGPRTGIDPLFLAAAVPAAEGRAQRVLDAGTGTGMAALALCVRVHDASVTGVEVQPDLANLARENARLNGLEDRLNVIEADIAAARDGHAEAGLLSESFDHVAANPPYYPRGESRAPARPAAAKAYNCEKGDLERWVRFLTRMAAPGATVTLIHRSCTLDELLALLRGRFGALRVYPLFPKADAPARRILVQGVKGSRAPLELLPGMVLHEAHGGYTPGADAVLRGTAAIRLR